MYKFEKEFRRECPETAGETDMVFDLENYKDWLESKITLKDDIKDGELFQFFQKISKQEDCPLEFVELVNKEFWNLI